MRLPDFFQDILLPGSARGAIATREELIGAIGRATPAQALLFAQQALDTIADGELVRLIAQKVGADKIPKPVNSVLDFPIGKKWHDGDVSIRPGANDQDTKDLVRLMQRALVKIGAHHARGHDVAKLLQMPFGADGGMGATTIAALNEAMTLAGAPANLRNLTVESVLGKEVAKHLELLLKDTIPIVHPAVLNAPPPPDQRKVTLFVGMGDFSKHEADAVRRILPAGNELAWVGDSVLGDDVIKVPIGGRSIVFDLKTEDGRTNFVNTAFTPPLGAAQKQKVKDALEAQSWGISDARDEIAMMALEFHKVEVSNGRRTLESLFFSGHSAGGGIWGDHNGELPMASLRAVVEAFPNAAGTVKAVFPPACNHNHPANVEEFVSMFPNVEQVGGYSAYAPGTWVGGIAHCVAWAECLKDGAEIVTPEMMFGKLTELKRQAGNNRDNPLFYANEKKFHLAIWNKADGLYRYYEHNYDNDQYIARVRDMRANPAEIAQRHDAVKAKEAEFKSLLEGRHPNQDLRDVEPHGDNLARYFYESAVALAGTMGLDRAQTEYAQGWKSKGLRARYYGQILEKFTSREFFGALIDGANAQLAAIGFASKSPAQLASKDLKRKAMLDYIESLNAAVGQLRAGQKASDKVAQLYTEMKMRIAGLENIPSSWT